MVGGELLDCRPRITTQLLLDLLAQRLVVVGF
jgi:hypothetical protein